MEVTINLEEKEMQKRFGDKLDQNEAGDMPSVLAKVFSAFTNRKVVTLKKDGFNGGSKAEDDRSTSIRCSVKANEGHLYPLDKCFLFIANKPMLVDFDKVRGGYPTLTAPRMRPLRMCAVYYRLLFVTVQIGSVEFHRVQKNTSSARTFDITVSSKKSLVVLSFDVEITFCSICRRRLCRGFEDCLEPDNLISSCLLSSYKVHMKDMSGPHQFVNLQRNIYKELYRFLTEKKIRIKNINASNAFDEGDGNEDEDGDDDPYMRTIKRERAEVPWLSRFDLLT